MESIKKTPYLMAKSSL